MARSVAGSRRAENVESGLDPLPGASQTERDAIANFIATQITGLDANGRQIDRRAAAGRATGIPRLSAIQTLPPCDSPGIRCLQSGSSLSVCRRQIHSRLEVGYSLLCERGAATEVLLRPGTPTTQFDLSHSAVLTIAQLLCAHKYGGGDLGDPGFAREMTDEVPGGRRLLWLRDYPALFESVLAQMGYDCTPNSAERRAVAEQGCFKLRVKGSMCSTGAASTSKWQDDQKNFHADEDRPRTLRCVCVLWGARTWFLEDNKAANNWLKREVTDRIHLKRNVLSRLQLSKVKKIAKSKRKEIQLGFFVDCVVAAKQCVPVIEPVGYGWDSVTCRRVKGRVDRPTHLIHAVPTSSEVDEFGFGMPGTNGLLDGVEGEIQRIVVVLDGLPTPSVWDRYSLTSYD